MTSRYLPSDSTCTLQRSYSSPSIQFGSPGERDAREASGTSASMFSMSASPLASESSISSTAAPSPLHGPLTTTSDALSGRRARSRKQSLQSAPYQYPHHSQQIQAPHRRYQSHQLHQPSPLPPHFISSHADLSQPLHPNLAFSPQSTLAPGEFSISGGSHNPGLDPLVIQQIQSQPQQQHPRLQAEMFCPPSTNLTPPLLVTPSSSQQSSYDAYESAVGSPNDPSEETYDVGMQRGGYMQQPSQQQQQCASQGLPGAATGSKPSIGYEGYINDGSIEIDDQGTWADRTMSGQDALSGLGGFTSGVPPVFPSSVAAAPSYFSAYPQASHSTYAAPDEGPYTYGDNPFYPRQQTAVQSAPPHLSSFSYRQDPRTSSQLQSRPESFLQLQPPATSMNPAEFIWDLQPGYAHPLSASHSQSHATLDGSFAPYHPSLQHHASPSNFSSLNSTPGLTLLPSSSTATPAIFSVNPSALTLPSTPVDHQTETPQPNHENDEEFIGQDPGATTGAMNGEERSRMSSDSDDETTGDVRDRGDAEMKLSPRGSDEHTPPFERPKTKNGNKPRTTLSKDQKIALIRMSQSQPELTQEHIAAKFECVIFSVSGSVPFGRALLF